MQISTEKQHTSGVKKMADKLKQSRQANQVRKKTGAKRSSSFEKQTKVTLLEELLLESEIQEIE